MSGKIIGLVFSTLPLKRKNIPPALLTKRKPFPSFVLSINPITTTIMTPAQPIRMNATTQTLIDGIEANTSPKQRKAAVLTADYTITVQELVDAVIDGYEEIIFERDNGFNYYRPQDTRPWQTWNNPAAWADIDGNLAIDIKVFLNEWLTETIFDRFKD